MGSTLTVNATEDELKETAWKCLDNPDETKEHKDGATLLLVVLYFGKGEKK